MCTAYDMQKYTHKKTTLLEWFFYYYITNDAYYNAATCFDKPDFKLAALLS